MQFFFTYRVTNFGIFHFLCHICGLPVTQKMKNPFEINTSLFTFHVTRQLQSLLSGFE